MRLPAPEGEPGVVADHFGRVLGGLFGGRIIALPDLVAIRSSYTMLREGEFGDSASASHWIVREDADSCAAPTLSLTDVRQDGDRFMVRMLNTLLTNALQ